MAYEFTRQKVAAEKRALLRSLAVAVLAGGSVFAFCLVVLTGSPDLADMLRISVLTTVVGFGAFYLARRLTGR